MWERGQRGSDRKAGGTRERPPPLSATGKWVEGSPVDGRTRQRYEVRGQKGQLDRG